MKGKVELHPLVLLLALIGGTQVFGLIGIFAGPVILGVTFALLDMVEFELEKGGFLDEEEPNS
jgi:predicted PurR-regulated permease PerM